MITQLFETCKESADCLTDVGFIRNGTRFKARIVGDTIVVFYDNDPVIMFDFIEEFKSWLEESGMRYREVQDAKSYR